MLNPYKGNFFPKKLIFLHYDKMSENMDNINNLDFFQGGYSHIESVDIQYFKEEKWLECPTITLLSLFNRLQHLYDPIEMSLSVLYFDLSTKDFLIRDGFNWTNLIGIYRFLNVSQWVQITTQNNFKIIIRKGQKLIINNKQKEIKNIKINKNIKLIHGEYKKESIISSKITELCDLDLVANAYILVAKSGYFNISGFYGCN
jgi:hypothetical protein